MNQKDLDKVLNQHKLWLQGIGGRRADLSVADLSVADLRGANLRVADLSGAILPTYKIVPEKGSFIAYKKVQNHIILELEIPKDAARMNSLVGRKIRVSKAMVLAAYTEDKKPITDEQEFRGLHDYDFIYTIGEIAIPNKYDDDIRVECTNGIHCFLTFDEAKEY